MLGGRSEQPPITPYYEDGYEHSPSEYPAHYPLPMHEFQTPSGFSSRANLPLDNPSTDYLLQHQNASVPSLPERPQQWRGKRQGSETSYTARDRGDGDGRPLLEHAQIPRRNLREEGGGVLGLQGGGVPYPPTAYNQPPHGWTPPGLRRMGSGMSTGSSVGDTDGDVGEARRGYTDPYNGNERRW
jgi:hypothetical protein